MGGPALDLEAGLVAHLDEAARRAATDSGCPCRLRLHPSPTKDERATLAIIDPRKLPFDPDTLDNGDHAEEDRSLFIGGLGALWQHLIRDRGDTT
jgi:phospholipase D1/2